MVVYGMQAGPKSQGAPTITIDPIQISFVFQCSTFDVQQDIDATFHTWSWLNNDGSERIKTRIKGRVTFTNLTTGEWLVNDVNFGEEVLASADGQMTSIRSSGVFFKVRREAKGRQIAYHIGRSTLTTDFSTSPPTVESSENGRFDFGGGPCLDLGDPVTP
jgi:hypothetical protein